VRATIARVKPSEVARSLVASQLVTQSAYIALMFDWAEERPSPTFFCRRTFPVSLHPLAGRGIQEHFLIFGRAADDSYYGSATVFPSTAAFTVEHHDLGQHSWNRLRKLRRIRFGAEYDTVGSVELWGALLVRFLRDPELGLDRRLLKGKPLNAAHAYAP